MEEYLVSISKWFKDQPKWLQLAATRFLEQGHLDDEQVGEFAKLCLEEAQGEEISDSFILPENLVDQKLGGKITINAITNIEGVNALAAGKRLDFESCNLVTVYGPNGAGKSGYIRLLKHICGAKIKEDLMRNIYEYENSTGQQSATVIFQEDKKEELQRLVWSPSNENFIPLDIQIFDTLTGKIFVDEDSETCYEPSQLLIFDKLCDFCEKIKVKLEDEKKQYTHSRPVIDDELQQTDEWKNFHSMKANAPVEEIDRCCSFTDKDVQEINRLEKLLQKEVPEIRAKRLLKEKENIDSLVNDAKIYKKLLSDDSCIELISKKNNIEKAEKNIREMMNFGSDYLDGTGSDAWKKMWEAAENYFQQEIHKSHEHATIRQGGKCVLCQQVLEEAAIDRFKSFEKFMSERIRKDVENMKKDYEEFLQILEGLPSDKDIKQRVDLAKCDDCMESIITFFEELRKRKDVLHDSDSIESLAALVEKGEWIKELEYISQQHQLNVIACQNDTKQKLMLEKNQSRLNSLLARKWLSENRENIESAFSDERKIEMINTAISTTNTSKLSRKKAALSEELITEKFKERFNSELSCFGANHLKVDIDKTKTTRGKTLYRLKFCDVEDNFKNLNIGNVLSEGERRIASIAAFLADVTGKNNKTPFVFDDPISSLDNDFEESVAKRLVELSKSRQIIVFTHRLSLVSLLRHFAEREQEKCKVISINRTSAGAGVPVPMLITNKEIGKAIRKLKGEDWQEAKKAWEQEEQESLRKHLDYICKHFRIIIERCIEYDLLCGVVERFQRPVYSEKIKYLENLERDDCKFLDALMSKYSKYEHAYPIEAPTNYPALEDILAHIESLEEWRKKYRGKTVNRQS